MPKHHIGAPGIFLDMPTADYFADPCPSPSLSQSIAKILLDKSPLHAWFCHPRLNPAFERNEEAKFAMGNCAHALLLGRGKTIEVVDAEDWRTKAAREAREGAIAAGKVAVLAEQYGRASQMAQAARQQLTRMGLTMPDGAAEVVLAWREDDDITMCQTWFRAMLDWLSADRRLVLDFKSTAASASPLALPAKMVTDGWDVQGCTSAGLTCCIPKAPGAGGSCAKRSTSRSRSLSRKFPRAL